MISGLPSADPVDAASRAHLVVVCRLENGEGVGGAWAEGTRLGPPTVAPHADRCLSCGGGWVSIDGGSSQVRHHRPGCAVVRARSLADLDDVLAQERWEQAAVGSSSRCFERVGLARRFPNHLPHPLPGVAGERRAGSIGITDGLPPAPTPPPSGAPPDCPCPPVPGPDR